MIKLGINVHKLGDQLLTLEISNESFVRLKIEAQ